MLKIAVLRPTPRASVADTTAVHTGVLRNMRSPSRTSSPNRASPAQPHDSRTSSRILSALPKSRRAWRAASSGDSPPSTRCRRSIARCACSSSARSSSSVFLPSHIRIQRHILLLLRPHHPRHGLDEKLPARLFPRQLLLALRREPVKLRALAVLANAPFRFDPAFPPQPVQRRIQTAMLHLQQVVGF